jgi:hypothetical protein
MLVALIRHVFQRLVARMNDRFLEQRMNIKCCVKLGKNANDTRAMLSKAYRGEAVKMSSAFEWHKLLKVCRENVKTMNDVVVKDLQELMTKFKKCGV